MNILSNAFSLNMLEVADFSLIRVKKILAAEIPKNIKSVVGHQDTAAVLSRMLNFDVAFNRESIKLTDSDVLYVAQLTGTRLPAGATELPEGAELQFLEVTIRPEGCKDCPGQDCDFCCLSSWNRGI